MTRSTAMNINELTLLLPGSYRDSKHKLSTAPQQTTKEVNMKVRFKNNILSYSGKVDNLVFYWNQRLQRTVCRTYTPARLTEHNTAFGSVAKNLSRIELSPLFKEDLKVYVSLWNSRAKNTDNLYANWYNAYYKMMYALAKLHPAVNLATLTKDEIVANAYPCRTVAAAVNAGLLPTVTGYERLDSPI